ncbi:MAG TPA: N-acetyltransferase [Candidatus Latescibacteria bacterium]|nr:N-acetyltransferase [Candidatus Latescibacterota bacterium]
MPLRIELVEGRKALWEFLRLPWRIYQGDPNWVPPLLREERARFDPSRNPFFEHAEVALFLALRDREPVGRIAAIVNHRHNEFWNDRVGFFGFFEGPKEEEVAGRLFEEAGRWLRDKGMEVMRGPMEFSTNETCGMLVEGFDRPPMVMMPYNPPYYPQLLEALGLHKAKDLYAFYIRADVPIPEKVADVARAVQVRGDVQVRSLRMKEYWEEVKRVKIIYNSAWSKNWGFVPMTDAEFEHLARELKQIVEPELVLIAETDDGEPVGFSMAVPDVNQALRHINGRLDPISLAKLLWYSRKIDEGRLMTLGVREKFRRRGIEAVFYIRTLEAARKLGYVGGELSWILEDNHLINRAIETMGAKRYKTYRIYDWEL